jgi:broad specificity phosphatase PhoE
MVLKSPNKDEIGKTIVYLIRHGDREHSKGKKQGPPDYHIPGRGLSNKGKIQAKKIANEFSRKKDEIDKLYCTAMNRSILTANEMSKKIGKKPIKIRDLSEFNAVLWSGKLHSLGFWKHFFKYNKSKKAFDKILEKNKGKVLVLVLHGNVIRGILGHKLKLSLKETGKFDTDNCGITKLRFKSKKLRYIYYVNNKVLV